MLNLKWEQQTNLTKKYGILNNLIDLASKKRGLEELETLKELKEKGQFEA